MEASKADDVDFGLTEVEALELRELLADDPSLAAELDRIHAWDAKIDAAFDDSQIPIPEGMAARLKAAAAAEFDQQAVPAVCLPSAAGLSRRAIVGTALAASVLLIVSASVVGVLTREQPLMGDELLAEAEQLPPGDLVVDWQNGPHPNSVAPELRPNLVKRWGKLEFASRQAEIFDLMKPGAPRAILIAIPAAKSDLGTTPPRPVSATGGYTIGMWQGQSHVYVLIVEGNEGRYRLFLKEAGQLTMLR